MEWFRFSLQIATIISLLRLMWSACILNQTSQRGKNWLPHFFLCVAIYKRNARRSFLSLFCCVPGLYVLWYKISLRMSSKCWVFVWLLMIVMRIVTLVLFYIYNNNNNNGMYLPSLFSHVCYIERMRYQLYIFPFTLYFFPTIPLVSVKIFTWENFNTFLFRSFLSNETHIFCALCKKRKWIAMTINYWLKLTKTLWKIIVIVFKHQAMKIETTNHIWTHHNK